MTNADDEIERLRAELADARLVAKDNLDWFNELKTDYDKAVAERDALRALLREAHTLMRQCGWQLAPATDIFYGNDEDRQFEESLAEIEARIGAALNGDGDGSEKENI